MNGHSVSAFVGIGLCTMGLACGATPSSGLESAKSADSHRTVANQDPDRQDSNPNSGAENSGALQRKTSNRVVESEHAASAATDQPKLDSNGASLTPLQEQPEAFVPAAMPRRSRVDLMTARETAYLIDYQHSGAVEVAKSACAPKSEASLPEASEDEAEQRAAERAKKLDDCMKKARDKFSADVLRFRRDGLGNVQFVVYRRSGSALIEIHVSNVELDESAPDVVRLEIKGGVSGQRPIMRDRNQFDIKIPNGYSIELDDPQYGKLHYDEKVGLVGN